MGILDEAIKEHLELKRQHGAAEPELQQLEDEAFGAAERPGSEDSAPDPVAEAATEFMTQPEPAELEEAAETAAVEAEETSGRRGSRAEIADLQEPPGPPAEPDEPAVEEAPAMEHEAIAEPPPAPEPESEAPEPPAGPSTEERQAIAEQPTEMFDIEEELASAESPAPSDDELADEEIAEPRLAPVDPLPSLDDEATEIEDEDDDFWDEKRLSDELDQALEAPFAAEPDDEQDDSEEPEAAAEPESEKPSRARDEDVLEETPDFLEEAPEDDQLWFEQKPPKDFDFDD